MPQLVKQQCQSDVRVRKCCTQKGSCYNSYQKWNYYNPSHALGKKEDLHGLSWWLSWQRICPQCGRPGLDPWVGRSPGEGKGYPLQYSGLESSVDDIVSDLHFHLLFSFHIQVMPCGSCFSLCDLFHLTVILVVNGKIPF